MQYTMRIFDSADGIHRIFAASLFFICGWLVCLARADQATNDPAMSMVLELLSSPDRDTRGLAWQHVREGMPGEAVTRQLGQLLASLVPEAQVGLLEALRDRGDPVARPAIRVAVTNSMEAVRVAALDALGALGESADVLLLAGRAAAESALEKEAARRSLLRLRGESIEQTMLTLMSNAVPAVRVALLQAVTARKVAGAAPIILRELTHSERSVRLAAWAAAESLCSAGETSTLLRILLATEDATERSAGEAALLEVCRRGRQECLQAVTRALPDSKLPCVLSLVRALGVIGGPQALSALAECSRHPAPEIRDEAVRILADWPSAAAIPDLLTLAQRADSAVHHVLALRGLARLAGSDDKDSPDLELLSQLWPLANGSDEKRLILGAVSRARTPAALDFAAQGLDRPDLAQEAALASVMIAEKLPKADLRARQPTLQKALQLVDDARLRDRLIQLLKVPE